MIIKKSLKLEYKQVGVSYVDYSARGYNEINGDGKLGVLCRKVVSYKCKQHTP